MLMGFSAVQIITYFLFSFLTDFRYRSGLSGKYFELFFPNYLRKDIVIKMGFNKGSCFLYFQF